MLKLEKINDIEIKPPKNEDHREILHKNVIDNKTPIIAIIGKKG